MISAVLSVMLYRMAIGITFHKLSGTIFQRNAKFVASITAAMLNLFLIVLFNFVSKLIYFSSEPILYAGETGALCHLFLVLECSLLY